MSNCFQEEREMDETKYLILARNENKTKDIRSCEYNSQTGKFDVTFVSGKTYHYGYNSIQRRSNPQVLDPKFYQISHNGKRFFDICGIYVFDLYDGFWHIVFSNGYSVTYQKCELEISVSCLQESSSSDCLAYLHALAEINELKGDNGEILLKKQYEKLTFVDEHSALAIYLNPNKHKIDTRSCGTVIFPFGGNASQFKAIYNALSNQTSVIQGPPGTGKTQTILNIIANLLIQDCTVEIVSNNNSATENVLEKLASPKYGLGFLVAPLGKKDNKIDFIDHQSGLYPDLSSWERDVETLHEMEERVNSLSQELSTYFDKQERLACAKQELAGIEIETQYFEQYCEECSLTLPSKAPRKGTRSEIVLKMLQECEAFLQRKGTVTFWYKAKASVLYGLFEWDYYKNDVENIITYLLRLFYQAKQHELTEEIQSLEQILATADSVGKMNQLTQLSLEYLKAVLFEKYGRRTVRSQFSEDDLWKNPSEVLREYPIILSTTFSARSSLKDITYDYIIMDEASQVDIATGALALSCGKNAVIVGDLKQLPNVVSDEMKRKCDDVCRRYCLSTGYSYSENSFLKSVCAVIPDIPQTILREHYRCHPKIIGFCNQKFYHNELLIMTEDHGETDTLSVYRTSAGNHRRGRINQRQIDITLQEVLPGLASINAKNIGVITPYRDQANAIAENLPKDGIEVDTVHKFQGREKDTIVLTTVDDEITAFSDNPYLLNVAISRAKNKFILVTSGNEQPLNSNIQDLIAYIQYNNFEIIDSKLYSVFDLLYQQYTAQRLAFLSKHKKVSAYDSENLMYGALEDLLSSHPDMAFAVATHVSVRLLIRDFELLTEEERQYARNPNTHIDFLIYNRISKTPVLAIEVDGFHYHKSGTPQAERDKHKDNIFKRYGIPLLRCPTNGSGEMERIERMLFSTSS